MIIFGRQHKRGQSVVALNIDVGFLLKQLIDYFGLPILCCCHQGCVSTAVPRIDIDTGLKKDRQRVCIAVFGGTNEIVRLRVEIESSQFLDSLVSGLTACKQQQGKRDDRTKPTNSLHDSSTTSR